VGKKKATGMSKRLGFTDRATIAENKEILRYNERLEREAKGLPPEPDRRPGRSRRADEKGPRRDRPARPARPPRPPALTEEQTALLQSALDAAVGETGMQDAGQAVIARLAEHDSFDKASAAGWEVAAGGHAAERTPAEWDLLRQVWLQIRLALLEAYVTVKPDLEPTLARERKQVARIGRNTAPQQRKRRPRKAPPAGKDGGHGSASSSATAPKPAGPPSPADIARRLARVAAPVIAPTSPTSPAENDAATDAAIEVEATPEPDVEADVLAEVISPLSTDVEPTDIDAIDAAETEPQAPSEADLQAAEEDLRTEHAVLDASSADVPAADEDQLTLEI